MDIACKNMNRYFVFYETNEQPKSNVIDLEKLSWMKIIVINEVNIAFQWFADDEYPVYINLN